MHSLSLKALWSCVLQQIQAEELTQEKVLSINECCEVKKKCWPRKLWINLDFAHLCSDKKNPHLKLPIPFSVSILYNIKRNYATSSTRTQTSYNNALTCPPQKYWSFFIGHQGAHSLCPIQPQCLLFNACLQINGIPHVCFATWKMSWLGEIKQTHMYDINVLIARNIFPNNSHKFCWH